MWAGCLWACPHVHGAAARSTGLSIGVEALFTSALGLQPPWVVEDVKLDVPSKRIDFEVSCFGALLSCPACGAASQPVHDRLRRSWRHLDFFQFEAWLHADVPRVACGSCGKTTQASVPWARPGSGFTAAFEALALALCREHFGARAPVVFGWVFASHQLGAAVAAFGGGVIREIKVSPAEATALPARRPSSSGLHEVLSYQSCRSGDDDTWLHSASMGKARVINTSDKPSRALPAVYGAHL